MLMIALIFPIIAFILINYLFKPKEGYIETKLDKIGKVTNIILAVIYIPLSFIGYLLMMASDGLLNEENTVAIVLIKIIVYMGLSTVLISTISIALSVFLRKRGKSILSFFIQFMALVWFVIIIVLASIEGRL